jgi:hypothetical protein
MLLGAMLDQAIDFDWFIGEIQKLNLPDPKIKIEKTYVTRSNINSCKISSCKINITLNQHEHHHRNYYDICSIIDDSKIEETSKDLAKTIFLNLAKAEAKVHNRTIEEIHFHEVGALDSIIDIVGFSICYIALKIDKCIVSPIPAGSGQAKCEHGYIPIPAPATLEVLKNHKITLYHNEHIQEECLTPTAAAILSTVAHECAYFPEMEEILTIGYGAGNKIFPEKVTSNLRFVIGKTS